MYIYNNSIASIHDNHIHNNRRPHHVPRPHLIPRPNLGPGRNLFSRVGCAPDRVGPGWAPGCVGPSAGPRTWVLDGHIYTYDIYNIYKYIWYLHTPCLAPWRGPGMGWGGLGWVPHGNTSKLEIRWERSRYQCAYSMCEDAVNVYIYIYIYL